MEQALTTAEFPVHWPVQTRWTDNDMFGHLNNAVYYELFDTAINAWINTTRDIDPVAAPWLGVVAESGCRYFAELKFPSQLVVGLAVTLLLPSRVTASPTTSCDGNFSSAKYRQPDSATTPSHGAATGSTSRVVLIHALIAVSKSS